MTRAYVDSSVLVAVAFDESGATALKRRLYTFNELATSPMAEAEVRSAGRRERREIDDDVFGALGWVHANRALSPEIARVLAAGYVRGADCWHLATALYIAPDPAELVFLTLDQRQRDVAAALGFAT